MKAPKTTILGVLMIFAALNNAAMSYMKGLPIDIQSIMIALTGGIGLIHAADAPKA